MQRWFDVFERHYGTVSTYDVASKVVPPPSYVRRGLASLPKLADVGSSASKASASSPTGSSPSTPTLTFSPPSPLKVPLGPASSQPGAGSGTLPAPVAIPGSPSSTQRVPSPPHLTWDASRSSPPRNGPPQMRDEVPYSTNVWDLESKRAQKQRFEPPAYYPPPPVETHEWYRDILRQQPDPSKVKPVFPWEQASTTPSTPAAAPGRPPPVATRTFAEEAAPSSAAPGSFARTGVGAFTNAWDTVPGIQRYVERLSKTGRNRKNVGSDVPPPTAAAGKRTGRESGNTSSGGNASSSASGGHLAPRGQTGDRARQHRRKSSTGSQTTTLGFTPATSSGSGSGSGSNARAATSSSSHPSSSLTTAKDGDASSRDGDDEEDEDADVSTTDDAEDDPLRAHELKGSQATSSERDSDEGIDRIDIKFRQRASDPDWARELSREGGRRGSTTDESGDDAATVRSAPGSPGKLRRPEPRFVPTSPRGPRSPHLSTSPHLALPSALTRPSLNLQVPSGSSTAGGLALAHAHAPRSPVSPRLAAQALRNSTAARLTASGSGSGDGPPIVRATRVFRPETDTSNVKQQGLAALQRFVENMEAAAQQQPPQSQPGHDGRP